MRHWITAILVLLASGAALPSVPSGTGHSFDFSEEDVKKLLESDLEALETVVAATLGAGTSSIQRNATDKAVRGKALQWEKFLLSRFDQAFKDEEPMVALADVWAVTLQASNFLANDAGAAFFGDQRSAAEQAILRVRNHVEFLAADYIPPADFDEVQRHAAEYASENPMEFSAKGGSWVVRGVGEFHLGLKKGAKGVFKILDTPLMPLNLAKDFRKGSQGIGDLSVTADRFTNVAEAMPARLREEIEILFKRLEESESTIDEMLAMTQDIAKNASATAEHADKVVVNIQEPLLIVERLTPKIQQASESITATSAECAKLVEAISVLADKTAQSQAAGAGETQEFKITEYLETAEAIQTGAAEIRGLLDDINKMIDAGKQDAKDNPDRRPFIVSEYTEAAQAIKEATSELRWALADVNSSMQTGALQKALDSVEKTTQGSIDSAETSATQITDHIAKRIAQLLILAFALALIFVFLKRWSAKQQQE